MIHNSDPYSLHQLKEPLLGQPISSETPKTIMKKVKDIDKRLEEGWVFAYELWLYIVIVLAPSKGVFMCVWMEDLWDMTRDRDQSWFIAFLIILIFALYYICWSVRQALLHLEALRKKDGKIAAEAYSSVVQLSIHFFILCVVFLIVGRYFGYYNFKLTDGWKGFLWELGYPTFQFVSHYAIPVPISVYGSYQVKTLLEERKNLIVEIEIIQQPNLPFDPLRKKLEEIDQRLDRGWLFLFYKIWLYSTPVLGHCLYKKLYGFPETYYWGENRPSIPSWVILGFLFHCSFWLVRQAWFEIIAMKRKDVRIATKAYGSLVWLARYYSIWVLITLWDSASALWLLPKGQIKYAVNMTVNILMALPIRLIQFYLLPVGISIYGSKQVKKLLEEKQALVPDDDGADPSESKI